MALFELFSLSFLAATILPLSSEVLLFALLNDPDNMPGALWLAATTGNVLGACVNWGLGYWGMQFLGRRWFPVKREEISRAEQRFHRYGAWSLLLAWVPVIGDPLTVVAGALRYSFWRFFLLVGLGKGGRYALLIVFLGESY
ncbi:MAG: DedA family protein [Magnetococcales bacterium]|nr:DedA family protein [Magnetococcales bacterium]